MFSHKRMERIIGLLESPSTSLSPAASGHSIQSSPATADVLESMHSDPHDTMPPGTSDLETLPAEIISHILSFLPPDSLARLSRTCRFLLSHANNDVLWMQFVRNTTPYLRNLKSPSPATSWRELYLAHHPYWFLVQKKIWFADVPNNGMLILARYNSQNGCIEAFRLLAEHGPHQFEIWAHNPEVVIHTFNPRVRLWPDDPVIKLSLHKGNHNNKNRLQKEVAMETGATRGICSMISLCRPIPKALQLPSMALWPPAFIPADERVRNESPNKFRTEEHRPQTLDFMSAQTFRIRKWLEFSNLPQPLDAVRVGEAVLTFSTLLEESYIPTRKKPWQGIWVGDYSGHGCEFLLVVQRDVIPPIPFSRRASTNVLPEGMAMARPDANIVPQDLENVQLSAEATESQSVVPQDHITETAGPSTRQPKQGYATWYDKETQGTKKTPGDISAVPDAQANYEEAPSGRLEAIKLTGDVNVPRGEYSWIANDIGPEGLLRVANEQMFVGARTVRSWGQIAGRGFRHDRFIPSQLIMISHDSLAQYWEVSRAPL